ncbi:MAG: MFS transporter [Gammaproteobacteria bacterium]|nr:MFS transporter [Gammaproteobacteria bacterium]
MQHGRIRFLFLNVGHFLDHFFVLIFAATAALRLTIEWDMSYAALIPYATPSFVAFAVCSIPAGWLADRWSREGMMAVFFIGIGASSILAGLAENPLQIAVSLTLIGVFAAIYHPVGLAMVIEGRRQTGFPLAVNGVFGNLGVASAALITGFLIDSWSWQSAFMGPGIVSITIGVLYLLFNKIAPGIDGYGDETMRAAKSIEPHPAIAGNSLLRIFGVILFTTALGGLIFQSTTFALPKVLDERLPVLASTATLVGWYAFLVFSLASFAQLVVGYLVDNHSVRAVFASVAILQAIFFAIMVPLVGISALIVAAAFMLVVFGQIPINDVLVGRIARSEWRSRAYALRSLVSFTVMASAVPLIAWVHGTRGFTALFGLLSVAASLIFLAILFLPSQVEAPQNQAAPAT